MGMPDRNSIGYLLSLPEQSPGRWWDCSGLDHRSKHKPWYTNVPMMVFVQERTVVATGGCFVQICCCCCKYLPTLLADQMVSCGMAEGLVSFHKKNTTKNLRDHPIKMQKYRDFINFIFFYQI